MINRVIVLNNPLRYTDPSGHGWFSSIFKSIGRFFKSAVKKVTRTIRSALSKPVVRFALAAAIGITTGVYASLYYGAVLTEASKWTVIALASMTGAAAAGESYYRTSKYRDSGQYGDSFADGGTPISDSGDPKLEGL